MTVQIRQVVDEDFVLELAEAAARAHQATPGTIGMPPPSGTDLARRRRFH